MKRLSVLYFFLTAWLCVTHAQARTDIPELKRPRLVVGLMVDQMRWDYLIRYADRYGDNGFRRLMREGWNCNRTYINYIPSITAVGHTSVWTGSVPAIHGITGNDFLLNGTRVYCTADTAVRALGTKTDTDPSACHSPHNLLVTTLGDELRLATNFRSRVIGVAIKDRASILPAGHSANAAYWLDYKGGNFVSSTYYMDKLPKWVVDFNKRQLPRHYMQTYLKERGDGTHWPLLYPADTYTQSTADLQPWEDDLSRTDVRYTPYGMTLTFDMARAAIEGEQLGTTNGNTNAPDMLCLSISSTDMLGHLLGPNSILMEDLYLRLDREVGNFLDYLDATVGKGNYLFFFTADHAAMHNSEFMRQHSLPNGSFPYTRLAQQLSQEIGCNVSYLNVQFLLEDTTLTDKALDWLRRQPEVAYAFRPDCIPDYVPTHIRTRAANGYCPHRSATIQLIPRSGLLEDGASASELRQTGHIRKGTTHSLWVPDDTHIPLIFFGTGVPHGWDNRTHYITDIAATVAALLNIQEPSGCVGETITF